MQSLFHATDGKSCRSCGGKVTRRDSRKRAPGLCSICEHKYVTWCRSKDVELNETQVNNWLARQLYLAAERLKKTGVFGRCEAVTVGANVLLRSGRNNAGYQCGRAASVMRDGRPVCHSHGVIAYGVQFINDPNRDAYRVFGHLIADLALVDDEFFNAAKLAVECATELRKMKAAS